MFNRGYSFCFFDVGNPRAEGNPSGVKFFLTVLALLNKGSIVPTI